MVHQRKKCPTLPSWLENFLRHSTLFLKQILANCKAAKCRAYFIQNKERTKFLLAKLVYLIIYKTAVLVSKPVNSLREVEPVEQADSML
jgi:hypothetical protein